MNKRVLLIVFMLLAFTSLYAQEGSITGYVVDNKKVGLVGAVVYIDSLQRGTTTDLNGRYRLVDIPIGEYDMTVSYVGYKKIEKRIKVTEKTKEYNFVMDENLVLNDVVVAGTAGGALKTLNQQQTSSRIMNVIPANQIGSFPDPNIGDALKRISGIHVQYDQGEAKLVSIRGTDPAYSTVSINGAAMPSTSDDRAVRVDAIPADMVQAVEVSKTITPDMDGDAIGGAINLVTRKAPHEMYFSFNVHGGYSFLTRQPQFNGSVVFGNRFFNDRLGIIASASVYDQSLGSNKHGSAWEEAQVATNMYFIPKYFEIEQTLMERLRQSYTLGIDFEISNDHFISFTGIFNDYKDWRQRYTLRIDDIGNDYKVNWKKQSGYENVEIIDDADDYEGVAGTLLDANNDGVDDLTGALYVDFDPLHPTFYPELERHVYSGANKKGAELTHTKIFNGSLSGEHQLGILKADWNFAFMKTSEDQPELRDYELQSNGAADGSEEESNQVTMDYTDPRYINASSGFEIENIAENIEGKNSEEAFRVDHWELDGFKGKTVKSSADQYIYTLDLELPVAQGRFQNVLKFGAKVKTMSKDKQILERVKWHPAQDPAFSTEQKNWKRMWADMAANMKDVSSKFNNSRYTVGPSVDAEWVGRQNVDANGPTSDWQVVTVYNNEMCDGYSASEDIYAAYFMTTQQFGKNLSMIAGVRMERTKVNYVGTEFVERLETLQEVEAGTDYTSWLPGVHFRYTPTNNTIFRLAYSKTISRPSYRDLVPYEKCNVKKKELELGNPDIKPAFSHNFDLLGEYYFGSIGVASVGLFYKHIEDFRTTAVYETPWEVIQTMVPAPSEVQDNPNVEQYTEEYEAAEGKDFETEKPVNAGNANLVGVELTYQHRLDFLPGFLRNFSIYANYTHNWLNNKDDEAQLSGTAKNILNLSLAYENRRMNARLSYNYTSDFLSSTGISRKYNVYCDAVNYLDANIDVFLTPKIIFTASANNLLNEVQRYYQWEKDYTYSNLNNGSRVQIGFVFNIF